MKKKKKTDPHFAFVHKKPDLGLTFCVFTIAWFKDPDFKTQIWFWPNQTGPYFGTQIANT